MDNPERDFSGRLEAAQQRLREVRSGGGRLPEPAAEQAEAVGSAAEGAIRVTAAGGRLRAVSIEAQLMRGERAGLVPPLIEAANSALAQAASAQAAPSAEPVPDIAMLQDSLSSVHTESAQTMARIQAGLAEAFAKAGPRTGLGGDTGAGFDDLLDRLAGTLRSLQPAAGTSAGEVTGVGSDADGAVTAGTDGGGRVHELRFESTADQLPSFELGERVVVAVNAALDDLDRARAEAGAAVPSGTVEELQRLQEESVRQMATLTRSLTDIMTRIREP